jgi:hypothetical protein
MRRSRLRRLLIAMLAAALLVPAAAAAFTLIEMLVVEWATKCCQG